MKTMMIAVAISALLAACGSDSSENGGSGTDASASGGSNSGGSGGTATGGSGGATGGTTNGGSGGAPAGGGAAGGDGGPCVGDQDLPPMTTPPSTLSATGLYTDIQTRSLAPYARFFQPAYALWSDGAVKSRYAYLPNCSTIDTSDMDHWKIPVGARFWKEFVRDGKIIETRLIHRFGPGDDDWFFAAYAWNDSNTEATLVPNGVENAKGTDHDIPSQDKCPVCHGKLPEKVLSFSAIQLSHEKGGETIASLSAAGRLTVPHPQGFSVPGDPTAQSALGWLHANCGNCHNGSATGTTDMKLRLLVGNTSVENTDTYKTAVGVPTASFQCNGCKRIDPGHASTSAIVIRDLSRGNAAQMPPIASEIPDVLGVKAVSDWINSLP
jgi:hypothetical protein